ncbi:hypothetical protein [Massilia sp. Se16.2.3]|uniref:hypothetical protein n=1 Tax=Massilia sp. Se16.2.3 TaxID=2709303 RepID=UPI001E40CEAF|nr:hypothetical protein [Massilia sp. Se16.2.3]
MAASAARLAQRWAGDGVALHFHPVDGALAWNGQGPLDCPVLREATCDVFSGDPA